MLCIDPEKTIRCLERPWEILLIHHAHTDVGYTEHPKKVERYHVQFLEDVVDIWRESKSGKFPELADFRWTNEAFWSVERFLEKTTPEYRKDFEQAVREGFIGLTATYLHNAEIGNLELMRRQVRRPVSYAASLGLKLESAISCDINGVGWGYATALADNGVSNYFTCLHVHKGGLVGEARQRPFFWETVDGRRVLVWAGEVYHIGNMMGLAPAASFDYLVYDELKGYPAMNGQELLAMSRVGRYLDRLEKDGYPYSFVPMMISGLVTDNSPASREIPRFARQWNEKFGRHVSIKMVTLEEFFQRLRAVLEPDIPVWKGDWPDWWTDGVASAPKATRIFRHAQRQWSALEEAVGQGKASTDPALLLEAEDAMNLYIEHTHGHSDVLLYPWDIQVQSTVGAKEVHAHRAFEKTLCAWDVALQKRGEVRQVYDRPFTYRVWNASPRAMNGFAEIYLEYPEFGLIDKQARVIDVDTGGELVHQKGAGCRGVFLYVPLRLEPWAEKLLRVEAVPQTIRTTERQVERDFLAGDAEGTQPPPNPEMVATRKGIQTPWVEIEWVVGEGITVWKEIQGGHSLLRADTDHPAFSVVLQRTPSEKINDGAAQYSTRSALGRNRISVDGQRFVSSLVSATVLERGPVFSLVQLDYQLEMAPMCRVVLKAYRDVPRVDVSVRLLKAASWDAETVYISLPFTSGEGSVFWLDKAGALVRPRVDQLPNSLADFYSVMDGMAWTDGKRGIAVASPDAPLVQVGPLEHGVRKLHGHPKMSEEKELIYSWPINTCWETNFEINTGGFHEFRYSVLFGSALADPGKAMEACRAANLGFRTYRTEPASQL